MKTQVHWSQILETIDIGRWDSHILGTQRTLYTSSDGSCWFLQSFPHQSLIQDIRNMQLLHISLATGCQF